MDVEKRKGAGINSALAVIDEDCETSLRRLTIPTQCSTGINAVVQ